MKSSVNDSKGILNITRFREMGIVGFMLILIVIISIRSPYFLTMDNIRDIFMDTTILVIAAIGQMMIILTAKIDISVSAIIAFSAMSVSLTIKELGDISPALAILMGIVIGGIFGMINGLLVSKGKVPAIIATLGTMSIFRGVNFLMGKGEWVGAHELTDRFKNISGGTFFKIPNLIIYLVVIVLIFFYLFNYTGFGRKIYMVGSNEEVAEMLGVNPDRITFIVFILAGSLYGLCGVLWASRYAAAQSTSATGFEFTIIGACVIGGISIFGGSGNIRGLILGAFLLGILSNALPLLRINPFWKQAIQGMVILIAVMFDAIVSKKLQNTLKLKSLELSE